jgi:hypothetical protein
MARNHDQARASGEAAAPGSQDSLLDLLRQLTQQGAHLAEQQLSLLQAEVREGADDVKASVGAMLGAAVVGIAGLGVLLMGIAYLLGDAIDNLAVGTLIVGGATLVVAFILYSSARAKMKSAQLSAERTRRTLERTPDAIRGDLHTETRP